MLGWKNEDRVLAMSGSDIRCFAVFDGMGGEEHGDEAAETTKSVIQNELTSEFEKALENKIRLSDDPKKLRKIMENAFEKAHLSIKRGMTTATLVVMYPFEGGFRAITAHVGDSRAYRFREGTLEALTLDDNACTEAISEKADTWKLTDEEKENVIGHIQRSWSRASNQAEAISYASEYRNSDVMRKIVKSENKAASEVLKNLMAYFLNNRSFTSGIGQGTDFTLHLKEYDLNEGDRIMAFTDGVTDNMNDKEIAKVLTENGSDEEALKQILTMSQKNSEAGWRNPSAFRAKPDDISGTMMTVKK